MLIVRWAMDHVCRISVRGFYLVLLGIFAVTNMTLNIPIRSGGQGPLWHDCSTPDGPDNPLPKNATAAHSFRG